MSSNKRLINQIKNLEEQLRQLRIELADQNDNSSEGSKKKPKAPPVKVGDTVQILKPSEGQAESGIITRVNPVTKRVAIETINQQGNQEQVNRHWKNVKKIQG